MGHGGRSAATRSVSGGLASRLGAAAANELLYHWGLFPKVAPSKVAVLSSTVSSRMLRAFAEAEGLHFEETLTGFKWLGNRAASLEEQGYIPLFAFEEAIGFMFGTILKDKDGISALAVFCEMANHVRQHYG
eukprot:13207842-Ditylum_brightwellii.AAC.1